MSGRILIVVVFLWIFSQGAAAAGEVVVPLLSGEVYADGRPVITRTIQVRLKSENGTIAANAFTYGSARFTFRDVSMVLEDAYFLVVREDGFKDLDYKLHMNDFFLDSASSSIAHFGGSIILELERLPAERKPEGEIKASPKAIDARQLKAEIPGEARREYNLALGNIAAGDSTGALLHLEKAVELAPEYYDALNKLGGEYVRSGQYVKAEAVLNRARALNPNDPLPLTNLGILYLREGERLEFVALVKTDSGSEDAKASFSKAADVLEKALRLNPLEPRANLLLGSALYKTGDYGRAESLLLNALDLDVQMHEARLILINLYNRQRRYDDAIRQISSYLESNPNTPQRKQLEALKAQMKSASNP